jgi:hypothetical protein
MPQTIPIDHALQTLLSPLLFVSFLISLFLVERRDRAYRVSQHPDAAPRSLWSRYSPLNWIDPEPYQDSTDRTWRREDTDATRRNPATDGRPHTPKKENRSWFRGKKHRAVAKMEFSDAIEGWGKVQATIVGAGLVVLSALVWAFIRWFWSEKLCS